MNQRLENAIKEIDLDPIKIRLMKPDRGAEGWAREKVEEVANLYRRFLYMCIDDPSSAVVPVDEVDEFWHAHILDTQKYAEDCQKAFGSFLHHFPYFGMRGSEDRDELQASFRETSRKYFELFREDYSVDGQGQPADCSDGSCGAGSCGPRSFIEHLPERVKNRYLDPSGRPKMAILELEK
ncbi:MAG: hypothetical protein Q8P57_03300 [Candidatus Pacearchaeota archaeon]|nr:hypothetical protein [Candidatus Pacearchaeota archaeon]